MYIRKFLQRRDAVSVIIAVVLALILANLLSDFSGQPSAQLTAALGGREYVGYDSITPWQEIYLTPLIRAFLQLVLLELGLRVMVPVRAALVRRKK